MDFYKFFIASNRGFFNAPNHGAPNCVFFFKDPKCVFIQRHKMWGFSKTQNADFVKIFFKTPQRVFLQRKFFQRPLPQALKSNKSYSVAYFFSNFCPLWVEVPEEVVRYIPSLHKNVVLTKILESSKFKDNWTLISTPKYFTVLSKNNRLLF